MKQFALIGAAGFVAPRHMEAIKEAGHTLVAAVDKFDSVGILDSYFPNAAFFTEFERFDRYLEKLKRAGNPVDYISICSPNYLHDAHIRFGLRIGADVICEKPLVLNPWNVKALQDLEKEHQRKVNCIFQLRLHEQILRLKEQIDSTPSTDRHEVELTYITPRGNWYYASWKGDESKSGGIVTNIGIHFFDVLIWLYGNMVDNTLNVYTHDRASGILHLEKASVKWFLSVNKETMPKHVDVPNNQAYRSLVLGDDTFDFSQGFEDLHKKSYVNILNGSGFSIADSHQSIDLVHQMRSSKIEAPSPESHPLAHLPLAKHPFSI